MAVQSGMYTDDLVDTIGKAITGGGNFGTMKMVAPLTKEEGSPTSPEQAQEPRAARTTTTTIYCIIIATISTYVHYWNHDYNHRSPRLG